MSKILPWIIMIVIILGIVVYANPHLVDEVSTKIGKVNIFKSKEIDTGEKDCREVMGNFIGAAFATPMVDATCSNLCQIEGYSYKQWKCSEQDTLVCVCN